MGGRYRHPFYHYVHAPHMAEHALLYGMEQ